MGRFTLAASHGTAVGELGEKNNSSTISVSANTCQRSLNFRGYWVSGIYWEEAVALSLPRKSNRSRFIKGFRVVVPAIGCPCEVCEGGSSSQRSASAGHHADGRGSTAY